MRVRSSRVRSSSVRSPRAEAVVIAGAAVIALAGSMAVRQGGQTVWWMAGAAVVLAVAMILRPQLPGFRLSSRAETLDVSLWGLRMFDAGELRDSVSWADLEEVAVVTTPDGPGPEESYLVLRGTSGNGVIIPHAVAVNSGVLSALPLYVPGFDTHRLAAAMASDTDDVHLIWRAPTAAFAPAAEGGWQVRHWNPTAAF